MVMDAGLHCLCQDVEINAKDALIKKHGILVMDSRLPK